MNRKDLQLSKTISFILRHQPVLFELELDDEGWVGVNDLLDAIRREQPRFHSITQTDVERIIGESDKRRYEIRDGQIRALYGHSIPNKLKKTPATPPPTLFHGTTDQVISLIMQDGLKPMSRQYVHLSVDVETARLVARRKPGKVILLKVAAEQAHQAGIKFYEGNEAVWLADFVPVIYLQSVKP